MVNLAEFGIDVYIEDDDGYRRMQFVLRGCTSTDPRLAPYGALAELDILLGSAKTALGGQARELAVQLEPREEATQ